MAAQHYVCSTHQDATPSWEINGAIRLRSCDLMIWNPHNLKIRNPFVEPPISNSITPTQFDVRLKGSIRFELSFNWRQRDKRELVLYSRFKHTTSKLINLTWMLKHTTLDYELQKVGDESPLST